MKILFFSDHFHPETSAAGIHIYERALLWASWGHDVSVITNVPNYPDGVVYSGYRNRWRQVEELDGIRVVRVKTFIRPNTGTVMRILDYFSFVVSAFVFSFLERRPDVAISSSPHLFVPLPGVLFGLFRRCPHVFEVRDLWPHAIGVSTRIGFGRIYRMLERLEMWMYRRSRRIIAFTHSFKADIERRTGLGERIDVVINGANLELFSQMDTDEELEEKHGLKGKFVVGYLGTIGMMHGLQNVVDAAVRLRHREDILFLFVGAGACLPQIREQAEAEGLSNIHFVERQPRENMPRFWSVADVSLVHLRNDDLFRTVIPSKMFEAMAMGKPVLYVGPEGEGSGIVTGNGAGVWVPPADPEAFACAVERLVDDPMEMERLGRAALDTAPRYSREAQARNTLDVLERAAEG